MKFLKILLGIIVILIVGYILYSAMAPKTMSAEKSVVMNASPEVIYEEIVNFENWDNWSPWSKMDTAMVTTIEGSGVGSKMSWTSENKDVGNGTQEIVELEENKMMRTKLNFSDNDNYAAFYLEEAEGGTKVTWTMEEYDLPFMFRGMAKMMDFENMIGSMYQTGLDDLQAVVEAKPKGFVPPPFKVEKRDTQAMTYIAKNVKCNMADLAGGGIHQEAYGEVGASMGANGLGFGGPPMVIYNDFNEETMDMDADFAIPVNGQPTSVADGLLIGNLPAGKAVFCTHYGAYETSGLSWEKMEKYMEDNELELAGAPYEVYLNDPSSVKSEAELKMEIVYPIQ